MAEMIWADCSFRTSDLLLPSLGMRVRLRTRYCSSFDAPMVMGVLNVTPDSFSDGGRYFEPKDAVARASAMIEDGADVIDIGPESTRPGANETPEDEQLRRALPVVRALRALNSDVVLSIDTRSARVAAECLSAGADIINDVSAMRDDPDMPLVAARSGAAVILMHRRGTSATMQDGGGPVYEDVIGEIIEFLRERTAHAVERGVDPSRILHDPGIGFGKRTEHNWLILRNVGRFESSGHPVVIGASRKRFLESVTGASDPRDRDDASVICAALAAWGGASMVRVHDVRATARALRVAWSIRKAEGQGQAIGPANG